MRIRKAYAEQLPQAILKNINIKLSALMFIMAYYMISDVYIRQNIIAFYTRIIPTFLGLSLLIFNLLSKQPYYKLKAVIYNVLLLSATLMMYTKCIIHLDDGLASSVSGLILVLFLVSFELKVSLIKSLLIYFIPFILFFTILFLFFDLDESQILTLSNVFPIILIGLLVNRQQENLRFKIFAQTQFLKLEKERIHEQNRTLTAQKLSLYSQAKELRNVNSAKDKLFSIIGHDLRNPFNSIFGYSQLIKAKAIEIKDADIEHYANNVYTTAYQSYGLLNNLLHWARLQTGHLNYTPTELNVDELLQSSLKLLKTNIEEKELQIEVESNPVLFVIADSFMLETVIRNLLSNAVKYTDYQGKIVVKIVNHDNNLTIQVADTGIGIPKNKVDNLFKIESTFSSKGTNFEEGTGLGLLLCKEFVDKHNGSISVNSSVNKGSTFTINLPTHLN